MTDKELVKKLEEFKSHPLIQNIEAAKQHPEFKKHKEQYKDLNMSDEALVLFLAITDEDGGGFFEGMDYVFEKILSKK